jgi:hypothetical protein
MDDKADVFAGQSVFERIFLPIAKYKIYNNKEAKASEDPAVSGPRMSENTHCPVSRRDFAHNSG